MKMGVEASGSLLLFTILLSTAKSKDVTTCIPKRGSTPQSCHTFSLSCPSGSFIRFDTLQYHWSDCINTFNCLGSGQCCNIKNMNYLCHADFSIIDTYRTYELCSGRESCTGTSADVTIDVQEPTTCPSRDQDEPLPASPLSVSFEYGCIEAAAMVNLCEGTSRTINATGQGAHFMYNRGSLHPSTKKPTQCTCRVVFSKSRAPNQQPPTLAYQDVRLHRDWRLSRESSTQCSSVHVSVITSSKLEERHCASLDPVSSFYTREPEHVEDEVTIKIDSLFNDGADDEPEMIWLSLKASSPVTVTCGSQTVPQKQTNKGDGKDDDDEDTDLFTIIIPVICVTIAVACLIIVFVVLRKRKTRTTRSLKSRSARATVRTVGDYDIYETIDDLSRHGSKYSKTDGYSQGYTDAYSSVSVENFMPRQKHKTDYDKTTTEDDYNRITLRTSHELPSHDPDYARLHSDNDSGVVDTFAILHTNNSEDSEVVGIDNTANETEKVTNNETEYNHTTDIAEESKGVTSEVRPTLKRKDSYELPVLSTKLHENMDKGYSKPFKLKREEKQNETVGNGTEAQKTTANIVEKETNTSKNGYTEAPQKQENDGKTVDIVANEANKGAHIIDYGYEEVMVMDDASSAKDDAHIQNHDKEVAIVDIPLPKRNCDDSDSDSNS